MWPVPVVESVDLRQCSGVHDRDDSSGWDVFVMVLLMQKSFSLKITVQEGAAAVGPLYPTLDSKPLAANQYRTSPSGSFAQSHSNGSSLMDADNPSRHSQPSPSLELQLGPQELQVH